mgnify:CR=1 FL=1
MRERTKMMKILADTIIPGRSSERISELEEMNLKRAIREITSLLALVALLYMADFDDDDDKSQTGFLTWLMLYQLTRARKELGGLVAGPWAFKDN